MGNKEKSWTGEELGYSWIYILFFVKQEIRSSMRRKMQNNIKWIESSVRTMPIATYNVHLKTLQVLVAEPLQSTFKKNYNFLIHR